MSALDVRSSDGDHVIALFHPLLITHFARPPTERELATIRALVEQAKRESSTGGMLFVVARRDATGGIRPHVREFFERLTRENAGRFGASAVVVRMQGFAASLMRSFLTSLVLLSGKRSLLRIFASTDDACRWLAPQHGIDPTALLRAYEQATAKIAR